MASNRGQQPWLMISLCRFTYQLSKELASWHSDQFLFTWQPITGMRMIRSNTNFDLCAHLQYITASEDRIIYVIWKFVTDINIFVILIDLIFYGFVQNLRISWMFLPQKIMRPNLRPRNNHRRLAHLSYRQIHVYKLGCLLLGTFHVNNNSDAPNDAT